MHSTATETGLRAALRSTEADGVCTEVGIFFTDVAVPLLDVRQRHHPFFRLGLTSNVRLYVDATGQVLGYDFDTFIGGHLGHFGTRADVETQGRYVADLQAATREGPCARWTSPTRSQACPRENTFAQFKVHTDALSTGPSSSCPVPG